MGVLFEPLRTFEWGRLRPLVDPKLRFQTRLITNRESLMKDYFPLHTNSQITRSSESSSGFGISLQQYLMRELPQIPLCFSFHSVFDNCYASFVF
jgi:hypothetical protein